MATPEGRRQNRELEQPVGEQQQERGDELPHPGGHADHLRRQWLAGGTRAHRDRSTFCPSTRCRPSMRPPRARAPTPGRPDAGHLSATVRHEGSITETEISATDAKVTEAAKGLKDRHFTPMPERRKCSFRDVRTVCGAAAGK